ncbi:Signal transduction histidine kinase [Rhizobium sp. NFR07]|uniref:response regulator n=1 Tax=Rhizobium sp. NFR07 TaxID=1566262 RepID=UPI0008E50B96|nr:response regulator [Rhizobium sp. NFR07]SFB64692.1 Signal transduction histidine kinase [Rhizobium sp. NFR07]
MIKARPAFLLLCAALIPMLVLAALMGWFVISERQTALADGIQDRASMLAAAVQRDLETQIQLLSLVAESPRLDLPVSRSSFAETARRLKARAPQWQQIRVTNDEGDVVLSFPPLATSASRKVVDQESHERVVSSGVGLIGNVLLGSGGKAAFAVRVPIQRNDRTKAVLSAVIRPEMIAEILRNGGLPHDWTAWVTDSRNRLVAATVMSDLEARPVSEFANAVEGDRFQLFDGSSLQTAGALLEGTPWRVHVGLPSAVYERPAQQAILLLIAAGALIAFLCAVATVLLYRELRARTAERESVANWQRMDALGKLTGQAAHDFNNLLMVFQSGVEGIERRRDDEERVSRLLNHMKEGLSRGKNITRRLLSFAKRSNQGAEHIELLIKLEDMAPLLKQALNDSILIDMNLPDDLWPIYADPVGLEIALINLLTNSREAMTGGGRVTVTARNVPEGSFEDRRVQGPVVAITVTDTGSGISPADLERIFEPFFSTKQGRGPGLGLTQVYGFALGSGGIVKAASLPGHGSAFTLLLPKSKAPSLTEGNVPYSQFPQSVLIVDDTPASLESARIALDGLVANIITARSGAEALDFLQSRRGIEAVISDIMMPGMSGIELAEEIFRRRPELPVVLMTGYSDKLEAGVVISRPVVAKPFATKELAAAFAVSRSGVPDLTNVVLLDQSTRS